MVATATFSPAPLVSSSVTSSPGSEESWPASARGLYPLPDTLSLPSPQAQSLSQFPPRQSFPYPGQASPANWPAPPRFPAPPRYVPVPQAPMIPPQPIVLVVQNPSALSPDLQQLFAPSGQLSSAPLAPLASSSPNSLSPAPEPVVQAVPTVSEELPNASSPVITTPLPKAEASHQWHWPWAKVTPEKPAGALKQPGPVISVDSLPKEVSVLPEKAAPAVVSKPARDLNSLPGQMSDLTYRLADKYLKKRPAHDKQLQKVADFGQTLLDDPEKVQGILHHYYERLGLLKRPFNWVAGKWIKGLPQDNDFQDFWLDQKTARDTFNFIKARPTKPYEPSKAPADTSKAHASTTPGSHHKPLTFEQELQALNLSG